MIHFWNTTAQPTGFMFLNFYRRNRSGWQHTCTSASLGTTGRRQIKRRTQHSAPSQSQAAKGDVWVPQPVLVSLDKSPLSSLPNWIDRCAGCGVRAVGNHNIRTCPDREKEVAILLSSDRRKTRTQRNWRS